MLRFLRGERKSRLYRQWEKHADLSPEAIGHEVNKSGEGAIQSNSYGTVTPESQEPFKIHIKHEEQMATHPDIHGDMVAELDRRQLKLPILFWLITIPILILGIFVVLLIMLSC